MNPEIESIHITGTMVNYYFICHRKLWLFAKGLNLENVSGNADVIKGKILHENRFKKERQKEIQIDNARIDFITYGDQVFVHEVKKSKKFEEAHIWQLKYYIYNLQLKGVNCSHGILHYPASMRKLEVDFTDEDKKQLEEALIGITDLLKESTMPGRIDKKMCLKCAYYDFCYA